VWFTSQENFGDENKSVGVSLSKELFLSACLPFMAMLQSRMWKKCDIGAVEELSLANNQYLSQCSINVCIKGMKLNVLHYFNSIYLLDSSYASKPSRAMSTITA